MEKVKVEEETEATFEDDDEKPDKADDDAKIDGEVGGEGEQAEEAKDTEKQAFAGACYMGRKKKGKEKKTPRKRQKVMAEEFWDCNECTYKNNAEDFKCEMCFASKATSKGRKARRDPTIVQERVQQAMLEEEEEKLAAPALALSVKQHLPPPIPEVKKEYTEEEMKERFQCDQCDGHFSAPGNLARHKLTEHEGVRYACDQCGAEFTAQGNLRRHKLSKHEQVNAVRWECDLCKSTFTDQGNLRRHKLTKHEGATYDCYQCPAQFGNHGTLRRHILTEHEGVSLPRYDCDLCEAQFSDVGNLRRHKMTKHEGVKYNCDQCDAEFSEQGNLKRHKLTKHDGIRYDCDQCEARFYDQNTLKKHKLTKHEGVKLDRDGGISNERKAFSCQICGFKCGKKPNLKSHIKRRHCTDTLSLKELEEMYPDMYKQHDLAPGETLPPEEKAAPQQHPAALKFQAIPGLQELVGANGAASNHYIPGKQEQPDPSLVQAWGQQAHSQAAHMVPQSVSGMGQVASHMGQMGQMTQQMGQMAAQSIPQLPQKKYLAKQQQQQQQQQQHPTQHDMVANHGSKYHHEPRYIPGEQERLMQEQQQRLAVAGLMQEYCNQVMPGFDQNERFMLEQRERERLAHEQREREQRERYSSLQLPFSLSAPLQSDPRLGGASARPAAGVPGHHDPRQALDHRLPQVAPLDMRDRMFQSQHHRDAALAPDRLASNTLTEMYQRMRTFNQ